MMIGGGYEWKAPTARTAFIAPQVNNDFAKNLKLERNLSDEFGMMFTFPWLKANINGYYSRLEDVTEYSMAYSDIAHSFTYISLTGINKEYYGVELGLNFKVTELFSIKALGTISEAKYINNANVTYMLSNAEPDAKTGSIYHEDICVNKGMREGGTPLAAASIDLSYHWNYWYFDLIGNYYDKIYLYYSPITRYYNDFPDPDNDRVHDLSTMPDQAKGKGGFMLDASISKSFRLKKGQLRVNLMVSNILNNTKICTGGMEQNRRDKDAAGENIRTYSFENSPKKFYANGINGMLQFTYLF
jgi:outer membrane receptor protein involved in Fe transport